MTIADTIIVLAFFSAVILMGRHSSWKKPWDLQGYLLAARDLTWPVIGLSLLGADSGTALPAAPGRSLAWFFTLEAQLFGMLLLLLAGWKSIWPYHAADLHALAHLPAAQAPETAGAPGRQFPSTASRAAAAGSQTLSMAVRISLTVVAGGILLTRVSGSEAPGLVVATVMGAGLLVFAGGKLPVVSLQSLLALIAILAWGAAPFLVSPADPILPAAAHDAPQLLPPLNLFTASGGFPWPGALLGLPMFILWFWGTDQQLVQHNPASRDVTTGRREFRIAGAVKIALLLAFACTALFLSPGDYHRVLSGDPASRGVAIAGIIAAMVSSLAGAFSTPSSPLMLDLYRSWSPKSSSKQLLLAGRLATIALIVLAILWVPMARLVEITHGDWFIKALVLLASPAAAVYVLGMFWKRATGRLACWALGISGSLAVASLIFGALSGEAETLHPAIRRALEIHHLDGAVYLLVVAALVVAVGSVTRAGRTLPALDAPITRSPNSPQA